MLLSDRLASTVAPASAPYVDGGIGAHRSSQISTWIASPGRSAQANTSLGLRDVDAGDRGRDPREAVRVQGVERGAAGGAHRGTSVATSARPASACKGAFASGGPARWSAER